LCVNGTEWAQPCASIGLTTCSSSGARPRCI
jgi:hypothetical protein